MGHLHPGTSVVRGARRQRPPLLWLPPFLVWSLQKVHPLTEMSALPPVAVVEIRPQVSPALRLLPLTLKALASSSRNAKVSV